MASVVGGTNVTDTSRHKASNSPRRTEKKKTFSSLKKNSIKVIKNIKDVDVQGEVGISRKET